MLDEKAELNATLAEARDRLREIERQERQGTSQQLVGKCYRFRNSYSCPEGPQDYWPLYSRILGVDEDANCVVLQFQTDRDGDCRINRESRSPDSGCFGVEIARDEYDAAAAAFLARVSELMNG
jgi:hypothetical protein